MKIKPPNARARIAQKGLFIVAVPLVLGTVFLLLLYAMLAQTEVEAKGEAHVSDVLASVFLLGREVFKSINAVTAYTFLQTEAAEQRYESSRKTVLNEYVHLKGLVKDQPEAQKRAEHAEVLQIRILKICDGLRDYVADGGTLTNLMAVKALRSQLEALVEECTSELLEVTRLVQQESSKRSQESLQMRHNMKVLILVGVVLNFIVTTILMLLFSRQITRRVNTLTDNASRLATGEPLLPELGGGDEIGVLDSMFHRMARAVEEAEKKQRALVDNAVDVICSIDKSNRFIAVSQASEKVWGIKAEDLIGRRFVEIIDPSDAEDTISAFSTIRKSGLSMEI